TLLLRIAAELREAKRLAALVDLEVTTSVQDLGLAELHIAVTAEVLREATRVGLPLPDATRQILQDWISPLSNLPAGSDPPALADAMNGILASARDSVDLRRELRALVREARDPYRVLTATLEAFADYQPVIILDGLDKMPPELARGFFIGNAQKPMADAP